MEKAAVLRFSLAFIVDARNQGFGSSNGERSTHFGGHGDIFSAPSLGGDVFCLAGVSLCLHGWEDSRRMPLAGGVHTRD